MATLNKTRLIEVVAGPYGSGKTTFAESFIVKQKRGLTYLNPDLIASGISPMDFEKASFQAGRVLIAEVNQLIQRGDSFCFESTLSGRTWFPILRNAVAEGYEVVIYFLYLENVQSNLDRIRERVRQGGHSIPKESVMRRHPRVFDNFWNLYRPLCTDWFMFDNSKKKPSLLFSKAEYADLDAANAAHFETQFLAGRILRRKAAHGRKSKKT